MGIYIPNINADQFDKLCAEKGLKFIYIFVPASHGRLIDADVLSTATLNSKYWDNADEDVAWELVQDAPTVIEAGE